MNNINEIWRTIKGYEGLYEVSNLGRVKSLSKKIKNGQGYRITKERVLKNIKDSYNYEVVRLCRNCKNTQPKVHRLVAQAFIKNPNNKPQVNHKDGVKSNNFWKNLEWATCQDNIRHAYKTGLKNSDSVKKKVAQIRDGKVLKIWKSQSEAARRTSTSHKTVSSCCRGDAKTAGGFRWAFA